VGNYGVELVEQNIDECVLCRLCLDASPEGAIKIVKLYDNDAVLA
jgi:NAD-dependent dihydropyrimidine dehydrogenase PreA subunit